MIFGSNHEPTSHPRSGLSIGKTIYVQNAGRKCSNPELIGPLGVSYLRRVETRGTSRREGRGHARDWVISFEIRLLSSVLPQPAETDCLDNQREIEVWAITSLKPMEAVVQRDSAVLNMRGSYLTWDIIRLSRFPFVQPQRETDVISSLLSLHAVKSIYQVHCETLWKCLGKSAPSVRSALTCRPRTSHTCM